MKIKNKFLDIIVLLISMYFSFIRSIGALIGMKKKVPGGVFFRGLHFFFCYWPKYFWKKPTWFKGGLFIGLLIKYIFYNSKK